MYEKTDMHKSIYIYIYNYIFIYTRIFGRASRGLDSVLYKAYIVYIVHNAYNAYIVHAAVYTLHILCRLYAM